MTKALSLATLYHAAGMWVFRKYLTICTTLSFDLYILGQQIEQMCRTTICDNHQSNTPQCDCVLMYLQCLWDMYRHQMLWQRHKPHVHCVCYSSHPMPWIQFYPRVVPCNLPSLLLGLCRVISHQYQNGLVDNTQVSALSSVYRIMDVRWLKMVCWWHICI